MFGDIDFMKAIRMDSPSVIPTTVGFLPALWIHHGKEAERLVKEFPQFFPEGYSVDYSDPSTIASGTYRKGTHIDEWGCVWSNVDEGMEAIVTGHPVKEIEDVFTLEIPKNRDGRLPHGFMYLRLLDLCGFENAMIMFAEEDEEIETLIQKVLTYNKYQVEAIIDKFNGLAVFGDDLSMQKGLAIGPERWRKYLKPCYKELYGMIKKKHPETLVYMHTDGCIHEIMPDLVECVESLYLPQGGLSLNVELNYETSIENCAAILEALEKYRHYKG